MALNLALFLLIIPCDYHEPNNYIELMLWIPLIAGLLLMKKRGAALSIAAMVITLGTIARIVIYYPAIGVYELRNSVRLS